MMERKTPVVNTSSILVLLLLLNYVVVNGFMTTTTTTKSFRHATQVISTTNLFAKQQQNRGGGRNTKRQTNDESTTTIPTKSAQSQQRAAQSQQSNTNTRKLLLESIQLFCASTAIRKRRMDVAVEDAVTELSNDGFFKVVAPLRQERRTGETLLRVSAKGRSTSAFGERGCIFGYKRRPRQQRRGEEEEEEDSLFQRISPTEDDDKTSTTKLYHPSILRAIRALEDGTENINIAAFDETASNSGSGLRGIQCQVTTEGTISLTLVWYAGTIKETQPALTRLVKELQRTDPDLWHNIWCHCNDDEDDPEGTPRRKRAKFFARNPKSRWYRLVGPEFIRQPLLSNNKNDKNNNNKNDNGWLYLSPLASSSSFVHSNKMARDIARVIPPGSRVCDLYAGVGLFGLTALAHHQSSSSELPLEWVRFSGENEANVRCFRRSLRSLTKDNPYNRNNNRRRAPSEEDTMTLAEMTQQLEKNEYSYQQQQSTTPTTITNYAIQSASHVVFEKGAALGANVVIVHPSRRGLDERLLKELSKPYDANQDYVDDVTYINDEELDTINWVNDVETLIYVSSGTFPSGDLDELLLSSRNNDWLLQSATGYTSGTSNSNMDMVLVLQRRGTEKRLE